MAHSGAGVPFLRGTARCTVVVVDGSNSASRRPPSRAIAAPLGLDTDPGGKGYVSVGIYSIDGLLKYFATLQGFDTLQQVAPAVAGKEKSLLRLGSFAADHQGVGHLSKALQERSERLQADGNSTSRDLNWRQALQEALEVLQESEGGSKGIKGQREGTAAEERARIVLTRFEPEGTPEGPGCDVLLEALSSLLQSRTETPAGEGGWWFRRCDAVLLRVKVPAELSGGGGGGDDEQRAAEASAAAFLGLEGASGASRWEQGGRLLMTAVTAEVSAELLPETLRRVAEFHLGAARTVLSGIPMNSKRKREDDESLILSIPLLARRVPEVAPCASDPLRPAEDLDLSRDLQWLNVQAFHAPSQNTPASAVWQVSVVEPGTPQSQSLVAHLRAGHPAYMTDDGSSVPTHTLLLRGTGMFLHRLAARSLPFKVPRELLVPTFSESEVAELRLGAVEAALQGCIAQRLPALPACPGASMGTSETDLVEYVGTSRGILTTRRLERLSRVLPLQVKDSLIDSTAAFAVVLKPIIMTLQEPVLAPGIADTIVKPTLQMLQTITKSNEGVLLHNGILNAEIRRQLYWGAWDELEAAGAAYRALSEQHKVLADLISGMRPQLPQSDPSKNASQDAAAASEAGSDNQQAAAAAGGVPGTTPAAYKRGGNVRVEHLVRDSAGRPQMPLSLGSSLTIMSLGTIVTDRPSFHSQSYIWPVGFRSKRMYASSVRPHARVAYICEILDGGSAPEFRLTADDDKDNPISGISASGCWSQVVKKVAILKPPEEKGKGLPSVSGPEYFGYAHPVVVKLLMELPGSDKIRGPNNSRTTTEASPHLSGGLQQQADGSPAGPTDSSPAPLPRHLQSEANAAAAMSDRMRDQKQRQSKRQRWEDTGDDREQRLSAAQSRISSLYGGTGAAPSEPGSSSLSDGVSLMVQHWAGRIKEVPAWAGAEA